jgi:predicted Co/Zn/Cd cation transporter (cation efflux family)
MLAAVFALVLLFPIISATDDLLGAERALDAQAFAVVLAAVALFFGLTLIARLKVQESAVRAFVLAPHSDPRSPPRR